MRKIWQVSMICLSVCFAFPLHADNETNQPPKTESVSYSQSNLILQRIDKLQHEIKSTRYSHKTEIDGGRGIYNLDCSGLARFLLREIAPDALRVLPHEPNFSFPRAVSFYSAFTNVDSGRVTTYWQQIKRMTDIEPGDFIAWRKVEIKKGDNSGHVLITLEKPTAESDGSFRVKLIDSSGGKHAEDSRARGESGIGTGVMWFNVGANGEPTAFRWADSSKPKICPISMGRLQQKPKKTEPKETDAHKRRSRSFI